MIFVGMEIGVCLLLTKAQGHHDEFPPFYFSVLWEQIASRGQKVNYLGAVADASVLNHSVFTACRCFTAQALFHPRPLKKRGGEGGRSLRRLFQRAVRLGTGRNLRVSVQRLSRRRPLILQAGVASKLPCSSHFQPLR